MAQQHRNPQQQENQQPSRWRERNYGSRNEEERNRGDWEEQSGQRGLSGYSGGSESEQSGWGRDMDEDRWGQGGYGQSQYGQREQGGYGQSQYGQRGQGGYGQSQYGQREQGGYGRSQYGQREQGGHGQSQYGQREQGGYGQSSQYGQREQGGYGGGTRQQYGRQYESQSFDQPYPSGFQSDFSSSQRSRSGFGREGYGESGAHRGKGPKGYTRSDERLKEVICEKLTDDPMIDASEINIEVTGQTVKLTGTVDDRSTKYEVEELIERCGGVKDIDNQLRVRSGSWQSSQMGSQTGSQGGSMQTGQTTGSGTGQTTSQSGKEGSSGSSGTKRSNS
jgi:osmotically-inducible protein OsmY